MTQHRALRFLLKSLAIAIGILVVSLWSLWSFAVWIGSEGAIPYVVAPPKILEVLEFLEEPSIKVLSRNE